MLLAVISALRDGVLSWSWTYVYTSALSLIDIDAIRGFIILQ